MIRNHWITYTYIYKRYQPPRRNSALPCALSRSFRTMHWYIPRSWRVTEPTTRTSGEMSLIRPPESAVPATNGSPFLNHWTEPTGDPDTVQLNVALSPEFTTCMEKTKQTWMSHALVIDVSSVPIDSRYPTDLLVLLRFRIVSNHANFPCIFSSVHVLTHTSDIWQRNTNTHTQIKH